MTVVSQGRIFWFFAGRRRVRRTHGRAYAPSLGQLRLDNTARVLPAALSSEIEHIFIAREALRPRRRPAMGAGDRARQRAYAPSLERYLDNTARVLPAALSSETEHICIAREALRPRRRPARGAGDRARQRACAPSLGQLRLDNTARVLPAALSSEIEHIFIAREALRPRRRPAMGAGDRARQRAYAPSLERYLDNTARVLPAALSSETEHICIAREALRPRRRPARGAGDKARQRACAPSLERYLDNTARVLPAALSPEIEHIFIAREALRPRRRPARGAGDRARQRAYAPYLGQLRLDNTARVLPAALSSETEHIFAENT